jgi:anti-sigma-K factor RskA/putative zinc finger protein
MTEHVLDDLEAYALGALDNASAERVAVHLAACESCRAEAATLAEVVAALPDSVALREPRPALRERLLQAARTESRSTVSAPSRRWSLGLVRPWRLGIAAVSAAVIVLGAADLDAYRRLGAVTAERDAYNRTMESIREGARTWYMAGLSPFTGSGGTLYDPRATGKQPFVLFHDLPPIAQDKVLTIWMVSPDGTWARAATFRPSGQDIQVVEISSEVAGFDRCAVTLDDSPWGKHGTIVMESRIAPPTTVP